MSNTELLHELAITSDRETRKFKVGKKDKEFIIKRFVSTGDMISFRNLSETRAKHFRSRKDGLPVTMDAKVIAGLERHFPEVKQLDDGKVEVRLMQEDEVNTATELETALVEPKLAWNEAVVFCRVNGPLVLKIIMAWQEINYLLMEQDAKNA